MQEGVARDGSLLFPAFPYDHFTKLSDDDVQALYAYFMTRHAGPQPGAGKRSPVSIQHPLPAGRMEIAVLPVGAFRTGCPTRAPNGTAGPTSRRVTEPLRRVSHAAQPARRGKGRRCLCRRSDRQLDRAAADRRKPCSRAVDAGRTVQLLAQWRERPAWQRCGADGARCARSLCASGQDVRAIATYFADVEPRGGSAASVGPAVARAMSYAPPGTGQEFDPDARLYMAACASCHYNSAGAPLAVRPDLALNSALNLPEPTNLIQVVLRGINAGDGIPGVVMPGFEHALSDTDIARIAAYLRRTRTNLPPWLELESKIAAIRRLASASQ